MSRWIHATTRCLMALSVLFVIACDDGGSASDPPLADAGSSADASEEIACSNDALEVNDSRADARFVPRGAIQGLTLCGDPDWYQTEPVAGEELWITVSYTRGRPALEAFTAAGRIEQDAMALEANDGACSDGLDQNQDGLTDCEDPQCQWGLGITACVADRAIEHAAYNWDLCDPTFERCLGLRIPADAVSGVVDFVVAQGAGEYTLLVTPRVPPPGSEEQTADAGVPPAPDAAVDPGEPEPLTINSIIPNRGLIAGGAEVRLIGTGFKEGVEFRFCPAGVPCPETPAICQNLVIESSNHARCEIPPGEAGPIDLVAWYLDDTVGFPLPETDFLLEGFTYYQGVTLTNVSPDRSPLRGGIPVILRGSGLIEGTRVEIGGQRAANVVAQEDGSLRAQVPAGEYGAADVRVSNVNGQSELAGALFYYEDLAVDVIAPPVGPVAGGLVIRIVGSGLTGDSRVLFGDRPAEVQAANAERTELTVLVPRANDSGPVDVAVSNDNGQVTVADGFFYFEPGGGVFDAVAVAPSSGPIEGGGRVFVVGQGFTANTEITFDGRLVECAFIDANQLDCAVPPGAAGNVPVSASEGEQTVAIDGGYTYFATVHLFAVIPEEGAVAGGTVVTFAGSGFVDGMTFELGGQPALDLEIVDSNTAIGVAPPNTPGPVDVTAASDLSRSMLPSGYLYFDPITRFGGVWGEVIEGSINISVLNTASGQPEADAAVLVVTNDNLHSFEGLTNAQGQITFSALGLVGPAKITAAKQGFEATTIEDAEAENITIYLQPNDGEGNPPPGVPGVILSGRAMGVDQVAKPRDLRFINIMVIETSHPGPHDRPRLPPPGPGGILVEDGAFEILARPGELALIATVGQIERVVLDTFKAGDIGYWEMRQSLEPRAMGLRRFISASPGQTIEGLEIAADHPMDNIIPVDLDNPPLGVNGGPDVFAVLPRMKLGAEGYWELDSQGVGLNPNLSLRRMPSLQGWDEDITFYLIGVAFSGTPDNLPMSISIQETRDVEAGVFITPFVGSTQFVTPNAGPLGLDRQVIWSVHDGFDGPIRAPSANLVTIEEPALGPPKALWRYVTPSLVTQFEVPVLPEVAGDAGLGNGLMFLNIFPFIVDGDFNFDDFTYDDLAQFRWKSWAVAKTTFTP